MDLTSQAETGEHRPSTPPAQTPGTHNEDFPTSPLTSQAGGKLDADARDVKTAQPDEDEQQLDAKFRAFDWDDLQNRYEGQMEAQTQIERKIQEEFNQLMAVCKLAIRI